MAEFPNCPQCSSAYTYEDRGLFICPECSHEWSNESKNEKSEGHSIIKDSNGNVLSDGDTVTIIKDLKVKGSSSVLKIGTKVKNIRLVEGDHDIDCKIDGFGAMKLKSEFVKKV
ncbi:zinc ribbon domain-containing protein YjdM [Paenibacillus oryzisoli]|uniref:zinc ribbon domain-containing protein YjdM n=1 Tax=Paenibacillus oryzisoli TaxID=1850517 RepID=UPI003D29359E